MLPQIRWHWGCPSCWGPTGKIPIWGPCWLQPELSGLISDKMQGLKKKTNQNPSRVSIGPALDALASLSLHLSGGSMVWTAQEKFPPWSHPPQALKLLLPGQESCWVLPGTQGLLTPGTGWNCSLGSTAVWPFPNRSRNTSSVGPRWAWQHLPIFGQA